MNTPILHFECGCKVAIHDGLIEHLPADCTDEESFPIPHCIGARLKMIEWRNWHPPERPTWRIREHRQVFKRKPQEPGGQYCSDPSCNICWEDDLDDDVG